MTVPEVKEMRFQPNSHWILKDRLDGASEEDCKQQKFCNSKNGKHIYMCPSFYICHPKPEERDKSYLETHNCLECGEGTIVIRVSPYCGKTKPTGSFLLVMDEDSYVETIGVLCNDCVDKLMKKRVLSLCGGGQHFRNSQPNPDIYLEKSYNFAHPENYFETETELEEDW